MMRGTARWLGDGEVGALVRSGGGGGGLHGLGPLASWPVSLRTSMGIALASPLPMVITWGPTSLLLYNDAFRPLLGKRQHPAALGGMVADAFPAFWLAMGHAFERVRAGESMPPVTWYLPLARNGDLDNRWFAVFPAAIRDEEGSICGVLAVLVETTAQVDAARRLATLRDLALTTADARSAEGACANAATILRQNPIDIPFGSIYLVDDASDVAVRCSVVGLSQEHPSTPMNIPLAVDAPESVWPIARIVRTGRTETLTDLALRMAPLPGGAYPEVAQTTVLIPLGFPGFERPFGVLVAGISPRRPIDQTYLEFLGLAASQLAAAIGRGRMIQVTRRPLSELGAADTAAPTAWDVATENAELTGLRQDRDRAVEKARAARHETEATQRARDEFLALLGHELRDPLAPMITVLRLMRHESGADEMFPKEREILERQLARLSGLVDELRDVSRMTRGGIELARRPMALSTVLERARAMAVAPLARHHHVVEISADATDLAIEGDATQLAQAIAGLVVSAVGQAEDGSRIEVRARREADKALITIRQAPRVAWDPDAEHLGGSGSGQDVVPMRRADRGLGVGFPILRNIIVLHGGSVRATGEEATSGFDVLLPLAPPADDLTEPGAGSTP